MTFGTLMTEVNESSSPALPLKVSYGNEIRRATINNNVNNNPSFVGLRDLVANLFGLDSASVTLKYQDDDGDNITMSSDAELKDAILTVKEKNALRLFVDAKSPAPVVPPTPAPAPEAQEGNEARASPFHGFPQGPFGPHAFGPHYGPHHHHPSSFGPHHGGPHHGGPSAPPHPSSFGPHHGPHHGGPHHGRGGPYHGPHHRHGGNHPFPSRPGFPGRHFPFVPSGENAAFSPASPFPPPPASKEEAHRMYKDRKCAMKHQIKLMKENATTPEDKKAIKEMKMQFKGECKQFKGEFKQAKYHARHAHRGHPHHHAHHHGHGGYAYGGYGHPHHHARHAEKMEKKLWKAMKSGKLVAKHVADVTIPDNSELPADTPVTKTWRLKNVGMTAWPADSQLIFISRRGDNLNGPEKVQVGEVKPQEEVNVSVTFITPSEAGRYIGYYRMATSDGSKFGQRVWVSFFVPVSPSVSPSSSSSSSTSSSIAPLMSNDVTMD